MANDKKFIVKNGLLTGENAVIGDTLDRDTGRLQVRHTSGKDAAKFDGRVVFDHDVATQGAIEVTNDATNGIIAKFTGTGGDLRLSGIGSGDYFLAQSNQNNGIKFYDGNDGVEILYSNSVDLEFDSSGIDFKREPTVNGDAIWYAGNDGTGSGLDADLLDGLDSLQFLRSDEDDTMNGSLTITGNLTVSGNTTFVNTEQMLIADNIFTLNSDFTSGTPTENSGFEIRRGDSANSELLWDESNDWWKLISAGTDLGRIITTADEGSGNGFDADTVDGLEASQFLRSDVDDSAAGDITFDGDVIIDQQIIHKGDTDTYLDFNAADSFQVVTGGTARLTVANASVTSAVDLIAPRLLDSSDNSYLVDPAGTSVLNRIGVDDYVQHNGDTDTYIGFDAADSFGIWTGGSERVSVNNTNTTVYSDLLATRFVDKDATGYFAHPGDNSVFHALGIDDELFHNGDTDTKLTFADNDISLQTGGAERLGIDNTSVRSSVNVYGPVYYDSNNNNYYGDFDSVSQMAGIDIDAWIRHRGNTTAYFGFPSNNAFRIFTNNIQRFNIDNDSADFAVNVYAPRYYDSNNTNYYADPAGDSQFNELHIDDFIRHRGDTNTYMGFNAADQIQFVTGGTQRLLLTNSAANFANKLVIPDYIEHSGDTNTYFGFDTTDSISFVTGGSERLGIDTNSIETTVNFGVNKVPTAALSVQPTGTMGNNPYASGNILADFGDGGTVDMSIRGTAGRDVWIVSDADEDIVFADTGATVALGINLGTNNVVIGDQEPTYTDGGDNTALTTTPSNAKLHVNGSIYLNGNNDGIIFGRGTASFLKDEELAFGWGGGLYMSDATYLRIRNNKTVYSTGDYHGARFMAQADTSYYVDPDGTSVLNRIGINDRIFHNGDTDSYIEFDAADNFRIVTGNGERLDVNNSRVLANNAMHSPIFYDHNNTAYYGDFNSTSNMSRIDIDDYIRHRGDTNTYIGFNANDTFSIYTNGVQRARVNATNTYVRQQLSIYGPQDALVIQKTTNGGGGVQIKMTDNNSGEGTYSQSGTINFRHTDTESFGGNAAFYFQTTEPVSHFVFGSDSDGSGSTATNHPALLPDVNGVGYLGKSNRRWQWLYGNSANFTADVTAANMYANVYYDANNNAYYGDFASTSIMNTVRVNRLQVDGSTYFIDSASGTYGSIRVEGQKGGWAGYAIYDDWVFMSNGASNAGIYNDTRNEWSLQMADNSWTRLYANGTHQISAENGYGYAPNQMRSPIYYDSNNTGYYGNFAGGNTSQALRIGGFIERLNFQTSGDGNNNAVIKAQDYSHWIWQTATNWGIFWAGNNNPYRSHFSTSNPNELVFIGGGNLRASLDLDNGNFYAQGEVTAANFAIDGGNEQMSLSKSYTRGAADETIFDGTMYFEKRVIQTMQGAENNTTTNTSEFVKSSNAPGGSSYVLRTSAYRTFYSDYIEVEPGEELFGEIHARRISGSGGVLYYGIERFDKDKRPIAGNTGTTYFVASNVNTTSTSWQTYRGHTTIPTSHTVYNGSDGGGVRYVRLRILYNYSSGGALREFTMPILKRTNYHSRIRTDYEIYGSRYYDSNNNSYYLDPASTSKLNTVDASNFRDRDNTAYFMNPASGGKVAGSWDWTNGSIENLNNLSFNDPGPQEGVRWKGGNEWKIYESPDNLSTNSGGNLQFTSGSGAGTYRFRVTTSGDTYAGRYSYAQRFYDSNNGSYYLDPASTSNIVRLDADEINIDGGGRNNSNDATLYVTATNNNDWGIVVNKNRSSATEYGMDIRMGSSHTYGIRLLAGGSERFRVNNSYAQHWGSLRAPIFYDQNDTGYYVNPAETSRMEKIRFEGTDEAIELNSGNPYIRWMENGTDRFYIQWRGAYNAPLFRNQQGDDFWFQPDSSSGAVRLILGGSDNDNWGSVYAADDQDIGFLDDQGSWAIRHNRDSWTQFYINGNTRGYLDNSQFYHTSSIRAPIFYDRDNTAYYGNFASTSIMNTVRVNRLELESSGRYIDVPTGNYGSIRVEGTSGGWAGYAIRDDWVFMSNGSGTSGIFNDTDNEWSMLYYRNGAVETMYNGTWEERSRSGYMEARGSYRAPIFYDSNNTAYYANPASTSNFNDIHTNTLRVGGYEQNRPIANQWYSQGTYNWNGSQVQYYYILVGRLNTNGAKGVMEYYAKSDVNYTTKAHGRITVSAWNSSSMSISHETMGGEEDGTRPEAYLRNNREIWVRMPGNVWDSSFIWHWIQADNMTVYTGSTRQLSAPSGLGQAIIPGTRIRYGSQSNTSGSRINARHRFGEYEAYGNMRAPIFYDSNNTGYYVDPASTSQFSRVDLNSQLRFESGAPAYFYTSSGNLRGYIRATESNDSHFEFATSGNEDIIFRDGGFGGSWNQIIRGNGQVLISSRLDVPIMYDRNNTGYYVDPAGFSNFNTGIRATEIYARNWFRNDNSGEGMYNQSTAMHWYSDTNARWRLYSTTNTAQILFTTSGNAARGYVYADNSNNIGFLNQNGSWSLRTNGGTIEAYGNFYANIMYDRNNTGYYINPNGNSRLDSINANSIKTSSSPEYGQYYIDSGGSAYPTGRSQKISRGLAIYADYNGGSGKPWTYDMAASFNLGGRAFEFSVDWISTNSTGLKIRSLRDCCQNWSSWTDVATSGRSFTNSIDLRAPIFYDSNNTGFYVNPNGTSRMSTVRVDRLNMEDRGDFVTFYGNDSDYHSISSRSDTGGASDDLRFNSYHHFFFNADSNNNNGDGGIYLGQHGAATGTIGNRWAFYADANGTTSASGNMRAPIFYDTNNTGYYVNPSDFTNLANGLRVNEVYARNWFRNDNSGEGIYNQSTGQHFYSDDDDGWNVAGGGGANWIRFRDQYGGSIRGYVYADSGSNIGFLNSGGSWRLRIVGNDYMLYYGSSIRAPIFYDSNNTTYRFNGASDNDTRFRGVHNETMAFMALPGHTRSSGNYYRARPRITSDTNYWTGAMGWGRHDMSTTVANWGSGFIDSWSNPPNQPGGTSHWVGVQSFHYNNGGSRYGWQMVGGPVENLRFRSAWGGWRSWRTIPVLDINNYNGGSMYAGRYYDSNNTGYYVDPASTSQFNSVRSLDLRNWYDVSTNHTWGMYFSNSRSSAYAFYREPGGWSYPYPDVRLAFHTGIKFGANPSYEGMRFYTDYNMASRVMQVNGGSNYIYMDRWVNVSGHQGIYSGTNGAHFYPNNSSYGSWRVDGSRNGWCGIHFTTSVTLMMNNNYGGIHRNGDGWKFYFSGNSGYFRGNVVAYWSDRRLKKNFKPLTKGEGIDIIDRLMPTAFEWNAKAVEVNPDFVEGTPETALIAQEVQEVIPDAVVENKAGRSAGKGSDIESYLTIDYDKITPFIIAAVKDLKEELTEAMDTIQELKDEIAKLKGEK